MLIHLNTAAGEQLREHWDSRPWNAYPRPQMRRDSWMNLNGIWRFRISHSPTVPPKANDLEMLSYYPDEIRVPFAPESVLSGIGEHYPEGSWLFYFCRLRVNERFHRGRLLLHIGAADQLTDVFIDGAHVGSHVGGYEAMCFDITAFYRENCDLVIRVRDDLRNKALPYGKQTMKRSGMWYTPVSGIWQSVWLESVPERYIRRLNIENRGASVTIDVCDPTMRGIVEVSGVGTYRLEKGRVTITPENPQFWSPENPHLYEFSVTSGVDRVESYFALRTLEIKNCNGVPRLCLNGKPYFFHGLLDQGYWSDGIYTPASPGCYADDILAMKKLGFNTLRKHIKVEPEQFYYDCDRLGMIVFQDMVNNGDYSYLRDTVLPTIGVQKRNDYHMHTDAAARTAFMGGMAATVKQLKNHPCILYWTIFNEGWGQFESSAMYDRLRKLDSTRWIDSTSGWFRGGKTDVESLHCYFRKFRFKSAPRPVMLSEFGGISYRVDGHVFNTDKSYGYGKSADLKAYGDRVESMYIDQIIPAAKRGLCGSIYTQLSDVEDEINGILTYDRKVCKLNPQQFLQIAQALQEAVSDE